MSGEKKSVDLELFLGVVFCQSPIITELFV